MVVLNLSLEGKVALVTGASRGIGKAIALAFAQAGADVAICARNVAALGNVAEEIQGLGRHSVAIRADIGVKSDVEHMVEKIFKEFNAIDVLVNNAGIIMHSPMVKLSEEDWDKLMNTDIKGYYLVSKAVAPIMMKRKSGNIINISSINAQLIKSTFGYGGLGAYCTAKAGVSMLTKVLAQELASYNIRVNAIGPGLIETEMDYAYLHDKEKLQEALTRIPLSRIGQPSDIAETALFLASDASSYITGQTIFVDGGRLVSH